MFRVGVLIFVFMFSALAPWLPGPFGDKALVLSLIGFAISILAGLRAAFRKEKAGIFAVYLYPNRVGAIKLDRKEIYALYVASILMFTPIVSIVVREYLSK